MDKTKKKELMVEINNVWEYANFGRKAKIDVVKMGLLKCASGYHQGHTSQTILEELNMITKKYKLTSKGRMLLWEFFEDGSNF